MCNHVLLVDDSLADGRGQYEVDQYGRVTAALKALDEALRPSDFFPLTAPASPCDKDIISGLIWKPPLVASTSRETALEDYSKVSPSPEPGEDVVGLYEQCVRPSESNLNALLTSPPYSPQREEIQWQTVQDSTFAAQNKDMTIYDSEPSRFETSRRRAQIRENTARTRKSRATMPAHAPAANVQTKNALFYIYRTSSQTKLNWMSDCEDDVSPLHSSSKSPYVPHDLNPPSEAPSYSTSLKHETSNGAHAFAYANVSDAPHMLSVPLLSSGLPSTDQSKASSPSAARYEKTQHEKEQLQRGFTSSSLSSDKEHLDDSSLLSCPSNKTPSCRAVDVVVVIEDDHSLTSDVSNLMPAAHATPFRISSSPSTAEVRSPSRSLLPRGKPGSPASQDSKEV